MMLDELRQVVSEFKQVGTLICELEFGFAWNLADDAKVRAVPSVETEAQEHARWREKLHVKLGIQWTNWSCLKSRSGCAHPSDVSYSGRHPIRSL